MASLERREAWKTLGLEPGSSEVVATYRRLVRDCHPDRVGNAGSETFDRLQKAYRFIMDGEKGSQRNRRHELPLLLPPSTSHHEETKVDDCYHVLDTTDPAWLATRLRAVVLEFGYKGLEISSLPKKWNQVWSDLDFQTVREATSNGKQSLSKWLGQLESDQFVCRSDDKGCVRLHLVG